MTFNQTIEVSSSVVFFSRNFINGDEMLVHSFKHHFYSYTKPFNMHDTVCTIAHVAMLQCLYIYIYIYIFNFQIAM
jgi:hypothetical protein